MQIIDLPQAAGEIIGVTCSINITEKAAGLF
jgi:hypothetical protein